MKEQLEQELIYSLIDHAAGMLRMSYAPYSHYHVGAALLTKEGRIYTGCNIENAAYTPTNCAERTAFYKAISEGVHDFVAIAVIGGPDGKPYGYAQPCGVCRQVMMEFCNPDTFLVIMAQDRNHYEIHLLRELLPMGFGRLNLHMDQNSAE